MEGEANVGVRSPSPLAGTWGVVLRMWPACEHYSTGPGQDCAHWVEAHRSQQGQWCWVEPGRGFSLHRTSSPPAQTWGLPDHFDSGLARPVALKAHLV